MSTRPLQPWRDDAPADASERRAAELVARTHEIQPRPLDVGAGWDSVLKRATRPRTSPRLLVLAGALAMAAGVFGTATILRAREPVVVAAGTQWERREDGAVQLQQGQLQTSRPVSLRLETPQVTVLARECRFAAEVLSEGTRLTVFEGTAVVRSGEGVERTLRAGESALWPAAPVIAPSLSTRAEPPANPACADVPCLERVAAGDGLEAEVALFELGRRQPPRAVEHWRASLERFPGGVLEPEVRLSLIVTLTQQRKFADALTAAQEFEAAQADDPRVDDVRALRRQLEWLTKR
jgi:hypothetical protein